MQIEVYHNHWFPSPFGDKGIWTIHLLIHILQVTYRFRPLTGIKVSEPVPTIDLKVISAVSVPSRGLRYLNNQSWKQHIIASRFRPLSGIKVSELKRRWMSSGLFQGFRPLTGIKVSELGGIYFMSKLRRVSVPSRGVRLLNWLGSIQWQVVSLVFVPSRGLRYLNS